jgi:hypothetical protein
LGLPERFKRSLVETQDGKLDLKQERAELVRIQRRLAALELARVAYMTHLRNKLV